MIKFNLVHELRESKGLTAINFCKKIESIIDTPDFQIENKLLLEKYDGYTKLRPDYISRWETTGRFPEDPVIRQALCVLANQSIGELFIPNTQTARSMLLNMFYDPKTQKAINTVLELNKSGIVKINLYDNSISNLISYIVEIQGINSNQLPNQVNFAKMLSSQINMAELLSVMQHSCQVTTPTTNQLVKNATISACRYILTQLVRFF